MVLPFAFAPLPFIHFGNGKISVLPELISKFGANALIITGGTSFIKSSHWPILQEKLQEKNICFHQDIISREPSPEIIDRIVNEYRDKNIQVVVGIGGGSVLDGAKAVSAMLPLSDSVRNYLEGVGTKKHDGRKIPFIAIPTTSGTGSEATKNSVLSEVGEKGYKKSLRHDNFIPNIALVDPELTVNCPKSITSSSGMDAFTQLLESYLSTSASPMTDSLAMDGLRAVKNSLIRVCKDGSDLEARAGMSYASFISGITLANASLGLVHGYASALGGYFDIPHGVVCGTLMGASNRVTVRKLRKSSEGIWALKKYEIVGRLFSEQSDKNRDFYVDYILDLIDQWTEELQLPKLSKYGIKSSDFNKIIEATDSKCNPVRIEGEELRVVLETRL